MNRRNLTALVVIAVIASLSLVLTGCPKDTTGPTIYFLAKDGVNIDKKGDTTIILYTKYVDPGYYVEDNASKSADIQVETTTDLPLESKVAAHMGEVKKTGDYTFTYKATDEAGNLGTRSKKITVKNVSDIYTGMYLTMRDEIPSGLGLDVCNDTTYYSNITSLKSVAGGLRFSKVAAHKKNDGTKVSFKVDAMLYSQDHSPRTASDQLGYMGSAEDKEQHKFDGLSYEAVVDSIRLDYVYLQIKTQEYTAYTESDAADSEYKVRIQGRLEADGKTPKSKIVYSDRGVMLYIELNLSLTIGNTSVQNYVERYYLE